MNQYIIFTDSACDIKPDVLEKWGVSVCSLTFRFDGESVEYGNDDMATKTFYDKMRAGGVAKTAAVNVQSFYDAFLPIVKGGADVLYVGFSTGLSTTYNSARLAAEQLMSEYPERKILTVDTLCASAGEGLLLYFAVKEKEKGATIEETAKLVEDTKMQLCHWFTVDDLVYLKRGGRISPVAAFFGNALGIKPVLHVDNEGHLVNVAKVRGRKSAVAALADKYGELALDPKGGVVYISHADCMSDVKELEELLRSRYGATVAYITDVGPVIGAHAGPGTLALFFVGKER